MSAKHSREALASIETYHDDGAYDTIEIEWKLTESFRIVGNACKAPVIVSESEIMPAPQWRKYAFMNKKVAAALGEQLNQRMNARAAFALDQIDPLVRIPVVFICDDCYAVPTGVAITSLLYNKNENTRYDITVLGRQLSRENTRMLEQLGSDIHVLSCDASKSAPYWDTHHYVSEAALLKFDIAQILLQWEKVLYLDSDVLILDDLTELYSTELSNHYAAVVKDLLGTHFGFHTRTGLSHYFNSGVLLLNLKKIREDQITDLLYKNKANDPWKLLMDQDTFNVTFAENVVWLHPRYNLMYANNIASGWKIGEMADFYGISVQEMIDSMKQPVIQHLSSRIKPWNNPNAVKYREYRQYYLIFKSYISNRC